MECDNCEEAADFECSACFEYSCNYCDNANICKLCKGTCHSFCSSPCFYCKKITCARCRDMVKFKNELRDMCFDCIQALDLPLTDYGKVACSVPLDYVFHSEKYPEVTKRFAKIRKLRRKYKKEEKMGKKSKKDENE